MSWQIDTVHTNIGFAVKHLMVSTVRGKFNSYRGTVNLDPSDFSKSSFEGEVDVESIDTNNAQRDAHLRTNDFFDAPNHPKIAFKSTKIEAKGGDDYLVHGDLTIRGVTKPVTFTAEISGPAKSPYGQTVAGISARATVNRKDFGVNFNAVLEAGGVMIAETVKIEIDAEVVAKQDVVTSAA
jgi:polyisoprenoid-binding protein YceI